MNKYKKPSNIEIGEKLRDLRRKKDVKEKEVAHAIGRNISTYSRYESGTSRPSNLIAELLTNYFEVDVQEIMPLEPSIVMENSCNDSTASGNINSEINIS